jgi:small subunit ribosomal protein S17
MAKVRRRLQGTVVSNKMDKTIVVQVDSYRRHRIYKKPVRVQRKFLAHDPENRSEIGDQVAIEATRPLSKSKRWRLREILTRTQTSSNEEAAPGDTAAV